MKFKNSHLFIVSLLFSFTAIAQEVGKTQGVLDVSLTGAATYTIPISVPPGINGVQPDISLTYSSQAGNGLAGWGWNISGVSVITRVPATKHHDGRVGNITYTTGKYGDRFALDGQRLLPSDTRVAGGSGEYGSNGFVYSTEEYSNVRITSYGVSPYGAGYGPAYFEVRYPDGSLARYGSNSNSRSRNDYAITYWQNPQGVRVSYEYVSSGNNLSISKIKYGSRLSNSPVNEIEFIYKTRERTEQAFVGGVSFTRTNLLSEIKVKGNGVGYRNYELEHNLTSLGYERLIFVKEKNGNGTKNYEPIIFSYEDTDDDGLFEQNITNINLPWQRNGRNTGVLTGDFTGNGIIGVMTYPTTGNDANKGYRLYSNTQSNTTINAPFINLGYRWEGIFATTLMESNGRLMTKQGFTTVHQTTNQVRFKTYVAGNQNPSYERVWNRPTYTSVECDQTDCSPSTSERSVPLRYFSGDFNGDGLTDVIAIEKSIQLGESCNTPPQNQIPPHDYCLNTTTIDNRRVHFVNLDRRLSDGNAVLENIGTLPYGAETGRIFVADVTGNGKSNLIHFVRDSFGNNHLVQIFEINHNNFFQLIGTYSDPGLDYLISYEGQLIDRQILLGDFNGDGKLDFVIPEAFNEDNWNFYFSKGDGSFYKESKDIGLSYFNSRCLRGNYTSGCLHMHHDVIEEWQYMAGDFNSDSKSDIIVLRSFSTTDYGCNPDDFGYNAHSMFTKIFFYRNKNVRPGLIDFEIDTAEDITVQNASRSPIALVLHKDEIKSNREFALLTNGYIHTFKTGKDNYKEMLVRSVVNSYGITEEIIYKPLLATPDLNDGLFTFYGSSTMEQYPNFEPSNLPGFYVVSKLQKQVGMSSKIKHFGYFAPVTNMEGVGFLGFRAITNTNWHNSSNPFQMNVSKHEPSLRGAVTQRYTIEGGVLDWAVYNPSTFISKSEYTYDSSLLLNKVFRLRNTEVTETNGLENTSAHTVNVYGNYNLVTQNTTQLKEGTTTVQTTTENFYYDTQTSGTTYYVGRPNKRTTSTTAYGNTMTGEEQYSYDAFQNLTQVKKKGHNTPFITEDNTFDVFGNVTEKSITVYDAGGGVGSGTQTRSTSYQYDSSGRFLIKSTDVEGLETNYTYNQNTGWLLTETNPYGHTITYEYDTWGKKTKVIDYLGNQRTFSYSKNSTGITISQSGQDGSASNKRFDLLGRKIRTGVKNIQGNWSYVTTEYDIYDRPTKVSQPHTGTPSQWSETSYDQYSRPYEIIEHTGKTTNITYNGLTTTVNDGFKTITTTKDVIGNVKSLIDPGGTVNYTYYANGNLKTANYGGSVITIEQDGWGQKTKLTDPSAGVYTYAYNGFGEIVKETTPRGETEYEYSNEGVLEKKIVTGDDTDMETVYTYDPVTKLLTSMTVNDAIENTIAGYLYDYDSYMRPETVEEFLAEVSFKKAYTYDSYGRMSKEYFEANAQGGNATSSKEIRHEYKNGYAWRFFDQDEDALLWSTNTVNIRGQMLTGSFGNSISVTNNYDTYGLPSRIRHRHIPLKGGSGEVNVFDNTYTFNAQKGVLNSRNRDQSWAETFTHDDLGRLTQIQSPSGTQTQSYDTRGRITQNSLIGNYNYAANGYKANSVNLNTDGQDYYADRPLQQINYNAFKQPVSIYEEYDSVNETGERVDFAYNTFGQRNVMYYGSGDEDKEDRPKRKYYSGIAPMEIVYDVDENTYEFFTYLGGDAYTAPVVYVLPPTPSQGGGEMWYLHRDYLGSILAITDADKNILEQRHFGAWGELVFYEQNGGGAVMVTPGDSAPLLLDRGYTGHEHLDSVGLIHMNGRLYDPMTRRFLAPDNYVQDPYNTQNFNRYGYVYNNPLSYNDPSGEVINVLIVAVIGVITNGISNSINNVGFFKGVISSAFYGMVGGAFSGYIGDVASTISTKASSSAASLFQVGAHGLAGGGLSFAQGGNFGSGFLAGSISSKISSIAGNFARSAALNRLWTGVVQIGSGSVSGGLGSMIAGGKFWNGFRQGVITAALNHFAHEIVTTKKATVLVDQLESIDGFNLDEYMELLKERLIDNGFTKNIEVTRYSSWKAFSNWLKGIPTANVTIRSFALGDNIDLSTGGYAVLGSNSAIVYKGLRPVNNNRYISISDYVNVTIHELGHAIFSFTHSSTGIMNPSYSLGSQNYYFDQNQLKMIGNSVWGN